MENKHFIQYYNKPNVIVHIRENCTITDKAILTRYFVNEQTLFQ